MKRTKYKRKKVHTNFNTLTKKRKKMKERNSLMKAKK